MTVGSLLLLIKVLVIEDNVITAAGLEQIIGSAGDMEVVGVARDAAQAVVEAARTRPDVALVDLVLPGEDGLVLARRLLGEPNPPRVLIMTAFHDESRVREALDLGVSGFLLKDLAVDDLLESVRAARAGHSVLHPVVTRTLLDSLRADTSASAEDLDLLATLTDRERSVLRLLALGLTNAAIGERLGVTEATVKNHVAQLFAKLGLTGRVQLARFAGRFGPQER
ncbi:response regulator [Streptomyces sp. NPDC059193]|uniref:response regulator n=1 Tax=Streptomyces sp. NPDC059193 TaxID=3346763 RepID=UPI003692798C